jgi:hypothetical protein
VNNRCEALRQGLNKSSAGAANSAAPSMTSQKTDESGEAPQDAEGEGFVHAARLAMVHVSSHSRQRHNVVMVMALAAVSTRLLWQNGHTVGRVTASLPPVVRR